MTSRVVTRRNFLRVRIVSFARAELSDVSLMTKRHEEVASRQARILCAEAPFGPATARLETARGSAQGVAVLAAKHSRSNETFGQRYASLNPKGWLPGDHRSLGSDSLCPR